MVSGGDAATCRGKKTGHFMRRAILLGTAGILLAGCGSMSIPGLDSLKPTPPSMTLQLESLPAGAEARTSVGPSCRTPCAVSIPRTDNFTVTFTLDRYLPQTVPVRLVEPQMIQGAEGSSYTEATFDPSPVYAELQAAPPPKRTKAAPKAQPKRTSTPAAATTAAPAPAPARAPASSSSPFPPASSSSPFPSPR
jgi:hypothetical protein